MSISNRFGIVASAAVLAASSGSALAQATWARNVSDVYQHQRWGANAGEGGADAAGDREWQTTITGGTVRGFGGWCYFAAVSNQLYTMRQKGFATFGTDGGGAKINTTNATHLHDQFKKFRSDWVAQGSATILGGVNEVLEDRGVGADKGAGKGLIAQNIKQAGANLKYISADGTEKTYMHEKLADRIPGLMKAGDSVNLRLHYEVSPADRRGTPQESLWWAGESPERGNFHSVSVAGYDAADSGTIYFSDPDTNPMPGNANGNRNADGGWNMNFADWRAAPGAIDIKKRRFVEGATPDGVPVPGGAIPTAAEQSRLYFPGVLDGGRKEFNITDANFNRYDGVEIAYIETLEVVKAAVKPVVPLPGAGVSNIFQVTPGHIDAGNEINEFWLFSASAEEQILSANITSHTGWDVSILDADYIDPWGNSREFGGVYMSIDEDGAGLFGDEVLDFNFLTTSGASLSAWDFIYNDMFDASLDSLGLQAVGDLAQYDLPSIQIPTPGALGLLGAGVILTARRRRA